MEGLHLAVDGQRLSKVKFSVQDLDLASVMFLELMCYCSEAALHTGLVKIP